MQLLYEAANALEANMLLHLLEQEGYTVRIDGEYLQGGVGELQVAGFVRLMVDEGDYDAAKAVVEEWDRRQPRVAEARPKPQGSSRSALLFALFIGFMGGVVVTGIYYNAFH